MSHVDDTWLELELRARKSISHVVKVRGAILASKSALVNRVALDKMGGLECGENRFAPRAA